MKCKDCKDKLNCDYYMNDYPGGNPFTKKHYCEKKEYKVGDWIWLIESIDELNRKPGMFKNDCLKEPIRKKIISIVQSSTGTSYQVKGGYHIHETLFEEVAFDNEEDAITALEERHQSILDQQLSHYVDCPECGHALFKDDHDFVELPKYKYDKLLRKAKRRNNDECSCSKRREIRKPRR